MSLQISVLGQRIFIEQDKFVCLEKKEKNMTEIKKMDAGIEYCFIDPEIANRKNEAVKKCIEFNNKVPSWNQEAQQKAAEKTVWKCGGKCIDSAWISV